MSRLVAFAIVVFWFVMTLLLVRNEVTPESSRLREIPISHVLKILYLHEQPSDLNIYNGGLPIGSVRLQPRLDRERGTRLLDIAGDLRLRPGPQQKMQFSWVGMLEMSDAYEMLETKWSVTMQEPTYLRVHVTTPAHSKTARYSFHTKGMTIGEGELPMDQDGLTSLAKQFGDGTDFSGLIEQGRRQARAPLKIRARQSSLRYRGDRTDTFLVTVEQNEQMLIEAHFSQLGQILDARTLIGYTLRPESYGQ